MHIIHGKCFDKPWSKEEIDTLINSEGVFYVKHEEKGFILCRKVLDEVEILTICVLKEYRNQGIGKILLNKAFSLAKNTIFFLEVNENNTPAIKLYHSCGFEVVGLRKKYYNNKDNALIMRKENV
ncbi:MAG: ribosomal-protein-alanine N-acetyltransferase [Alphaproteobacteria bacterium ADurb.Bin438]|nr:MAG: ribosomal-protein-alanine N-acetyltransferase [Alphaproteobacteria bacterium ADurb.Bin438]